MSDFKSFFEKELGLTGIVLKTESPDRFLEVCMSMPKKIVGAKEKDGGMVVYAIGQSVIHFISFEDIDDYFKFLKEVSECLER